MNELIISEAVVPTIERYYIELPHALLLSGNSGIGLYTIAESIARATGDLLLVQPALLTKTSTIPQISVERVRELYQQTRTKSAHNRVVIIDDADTMTISAQNAFLKLLEEPNQTTHFILTSHRPESLLPTIKSRVQTCHIPNVSSEQTIKLLESLPKMTTQKKTQLLFIAEGLPAELYRLSSDEMMFREKASQIGVAKQLIEGNSYQRTILITKEKLTRQSADALVDQLVHLLSRSPTPTSVARIERLLETRQNIMLGGNIKLQLLAAMA